MSEPIVVGHYASHEVKPTKPWPRTEQTKPMKLNLNNTVRFNVTPIGRAVWQEYIDDFPWAAHPSLTKPHVKDIFEGQLWEAFRIFGGEPMCLGLNPIEANFDYIP